MIWHVPAEVQDRSGRRIAAMSARLPWIERKWTFDFPVGVFPDIVERLRGTAGRIEAMLHGIDPERLTRRDREGTWSVQENVGHLLSLDPLWACRIDDFIAGAEVLRPADMSNRKTHEADYNAEPIARLLASFRQERGRLVSRLDALEDADFARTARHPRLNVSMRLVDLCLFAADHDDYHLVRMRELLV
jgi:uncharacterized damage-inducible protein DinB